MTSSHIRIKQRFEKAANRYDQYSKIQQMIGLNLITSLKDMKIRNVLDLGCGTGLTTETLCHELNISKLTLCDFSDIFIQKAVDRTIPYRPKAFLMNFDDPWDPLPKFDLIFSNMAMQWSQDLKALIKKSFDHLHPTGYFAFSIPLDGTFTHLSTLGLHVNHFHESNYIQDLLKITGFTIQSHSIIDSLESYPTLSEAIRNLRNVGANCALDGNRKSNINRQILKNPGLLNYKIGIFIAGKNIK